MTGWRLDLTRTPSPSRIQGGPGSRSSLADWATEVRSEGRRLFLLADSSVLGLWGDRVLPLLAGARPPAHAPQSASPAAGAATREQTTPILPLPPGETTKDVRHAAAAWEWLAAEGARRDDVVVVLGGGVAGDLGGFVAATYLRGVTLWQVPTTVLAQVDSSVGGKVAINLPAGKNLVGAFHQAERVVVDPELLVTLPEDEYVGGLGEVVKYGLLDGPLLERLEAGAEGLRRREPSLLSEVIRRCVELKATVVEDDERDRGGRAVLNLGHTAAHALEAVLGYGAMPHGAAVGLGLLVTLRVSERTVGADAGLVDRTRRLLAGLGLPISVAMPDLDRLLAATILDKKQSSAGRGFVCLRAPGDPVWGIDVSDEALRDGFEVIRA